jgi:hypothetical protein
VSKADALAREKEEQAAWKWAVRVAKSETLPRERLAQYTAYCIEAGLPEVIAENSREETLLMAEAVVHGTYELDRDPAYGLTEDILTRLARELARDGYAEVDAMRAMSARVDQQVDGTRLDRYPKALQKRILKKARKSVARELQTNADKNRDPVLDEKLARLAADPAVRKKVDELRVFEEAKRAFAELKAGDRPSFAFQIVSADDLDSLAVPEWLVHGVVPTAGLTALLGETGIGKTHLALFLSYCVVTGRKFIGRPTKPGRVLYIAAEGSRSISSRLKANVAAWKEPIPEGSLRFYPAPATFDNDSLMEELVAYVAEFKPSLVVFDTWHRSLGSIQENDATDNGKALAVFDRMRAAHPDLSVLVLHHPNAQGEWRGSKSMPAALDTSLLLSDSSEGLVLESKKQRDSETGTIAHLRLTPAHGSVIVEGRIPTSQAPSASSPSVQNAYTVLVDQFEAIGASRAEWRDALLDLSVPKSTVTRAISLLVKDKNVELRGARYWPIIAPSLDAVDALSL